MKQVVYALQIADNIAIKSVRASFSGNLLFSDRDELFFENESEQYVYVFKYGVICFFNTSQEAIDSIVEELLPFCRNPLEKHLVEKIDVHMESSETVVHYDNITLREFNKDFLRLIMLNTSQSVALDRYAEITEELLDDTNAHTMYLETKGRLDISGNKLKRYIGKILNIKNKISENLYIFDSHDLTWDDEKLNRFDSDLKKTFDLKDRYRDIHDRIEIIKENLELFKDIMDHRESSRLEWIIIILILVEVFDLFIAKIL
ncbi:RMD1 family protein [Aquimarina intermedia]|uniref:YagE family uncharacterized protein n=1 Tax=Aquimarina intermedia TaxID=350814 RepID=A0A5S5BV87_9FLAO|nr:RMD1 family protein [Aquimarina intermedia]TYP70874.1 YagE family uncharacterized protein [Aquimarina intermedia]